MNNCRLEAIEDWPQRAHDAKYLVKALAKSCGVSVRALRAVLRGRLRLQAAPVAQDTEDAESHQTAPRGQQR